MVQAEYYARLFRLFGRALAICVITTFLCLHAQQPDARASAPTTIVTSEPMMRDSWGSTLHEVYSNQDARIWIEVFNGLPETMQVVAIIEVRDSNDISQSIQFREATVVSDNAIELSVPWMPGTGGQYQLRTFLISEWQSPEVLTPVKTIELTVIQSVPPSPRSFTVTLSGNDYNITYSSSTGHIRGVQVEPDISTLLIIFDGISRDSTLTMELPHKLAVKAFTCGLDPPPENYQTQFFASSVEVFIDDASAEARVVDVDEGESITWSIEVGAGTNELEFASTCLA